jgi:hypothetical protein
MSPLLHYRTVPTAPAGLNLMDEFLLFNWPKSINGGIGLQSGVIFRSSQTGIEQ